MFDALCKAINLTARACSRLYLSDWRHSDYNIRQLKKALRNAQQSKKGKKQDHIIQAHQAYLNQAQLYMNKLSQTLKKLDAFSRYSITPYINHITRQLQQTYDRVIDNQTIESSQKVCSVYEHDPEFVKTRHQHSAVESAINCLEQHGLDRCPDNGKEGFDYYVALAVLS